MSFSILQPPRVVFGRGAARDAAAGILDFGKRVLLVHGHSRSRAEGLIAGLTTLGADVRCLACGGEPTLDMLQDALSSTAHHETDVVVALGGGAAIDLGKALAAMIPAPGGVMDHLEVVGRALPLQATPLPFVALPTTAGTGAEVTKNAVIGLPDLGRKVSLRDDRMIARLAIVDPALTDACPRSVTLASGLDAITQVIEPYVCNRANAYTDPIARAAIAPGLAALMRLMQAEDPAARDALAWTSLCGGLALANSGLGAVHGLAGVIGGMTGAAHGAICGALLGPVIAANREKASGAARTRLDDVCQMIAEVMGTRADLAPNSLAAWAHDAGLPRLSDLGLQRAQHAEVAAAALTASSMKANPVPLGPEALCAILEVAG